MSARTGARGRWRLDSGDLSLDFVNTRQARWTGGLEQLETPEHLADWLRAAGLARGLPRVGPRELVEAVSLRESIDAVVVATLRGDSPPADAVEGLNARLRRGPGRTDTRLAVDRERMLALVQTPGVGNAVSQALHTLALEAARLVGTGRRDRLRVCGDESCSMRFLDRSNANTRRWCSASCCTRHHMRVRRVQARSSNRAG